MKCDANTYCKNMRVTVFYVIQGNYGDSAEAKEKASKEFGIELVSLNGLLGSGSISMDDFKKITNVLKPSEEVKAAWEHMYVMKPEVV